MPAGAAAGASIDPDPMNDFAASALVESPGNPLPEGIVSGRLATADRVSLRFAVCPSRLPATRGTVILLQGRNEAIEKYFETIADLTGLGYAVATFDWRGQGASGRMLRDPRKGHVSSFSAYVRDLEAILKELVLPDCRGPYAILAHSMGGTVALLAAPRLLNRVERIVVGTPLIALPEGSPQAGALFLGLTALRLVGLGSLPVRRQERIARVWTPEANPLTSDRRRFERNRQLAASAPQLFVGGPTASWLAAATAAMRRLGDSDVVAGLHVPTLFVTAGADRVVSSAAAERLAWRMRSGHCLSLPGARHELMQEADRFRSPFLAAFDGFAGAALPLG